MKIICVVLSLMFVATRFAIGAPPPSDSELSAAYCWGALSAETTILHSLASNPGRDEDA
jgi:hypothetical protein